MSVSTPESGHVQFTDESGTWCRDTCPRPEAECGALALEQNDGPRTPPGQPAPPTAEADMSAGGL